MSELQTDSVESDVIEPAVIENPDNGAELATASESEHGTNPEPVVEVESEESKQQKYINTQYGQIKQGERDLATANEQIAKFQSDERERQAAAIVDIPPMPNEFDYDTPEQFQAAVNSRDNAIIAKTNHTATNNAYLLHQQTNQQNEVNAKALKNQQVLQEHKARTATLGIKPEEMMQAENAVLQYNLNPDLLAHIASMDDSPLVIKHLAANAQDGYELATMSPYAIGSFLDGIKQKASALKPKTSNAPAPATNLQGNGVDPEAGKYKHLSGVKYS